MSNNGYRYPPEKRGWTCFHCDETFTTPGAAEDHFGATPRVEPGCILKVQLGEERGMLMELRKLQAENEQLHTQINEGIFNDKAFYAHLEIMIQSYRAFRKCSTLQDVFNVYDSMEGRALSAEERLREAEDKGKPSVTPVGGKSDSCPNSSLSRGN